MPSPPVRRPLKTRQARWAASLARGVAAIGLRPNAISLLSVAFAVVTCGALLASGGASGGARAAWFVLAAVTVQLRLLCNLLDGMVAVEGGFQSAAGEVYNDLPDRVSDVLSLAPVGYALVGIPFGVELGWVAASLALLTAYVRVLGGASGLPQSFAGPMAKPHRMFALTLGLLLASGGVALDLDSVVLAATLGVIVLGSAATVARRTLAVVRALSARA